MKHIHYEVQVQVDWYSTSLKCDHKFWIGSGAYPTKRAAKSSIKHLVRTGPTRVVKVTTTKEVVS